MRIVIDCRWIFPKLSGVGRYTRDLVRALLDARTDDEFILLFNNDDVRKREHVLLALVSRTNTRSLVAKYGPFSLRSTLSLPRVLRRLQADVFHSTNFMLPLRRLPCATVATFHDLIPFVAPHWIPRSRKTRWQPVYRWITRRAARLADRVVAVSAYTKHDTIEHLAVPAERVAVVHNGIDSIFTPPERERPTRLRERFALTGPLVIAAGRADPYKNLLGLVCAIEQLNRDDRNIGCVLIGEPDPRYPEVHEYVTAHGLESLVHFTGYLSQDELVAAYQEADLLVHPSLYEGFGFPPLEAMACGTPVVASNRTSLPEVLGDAAVLVDPTNPDELAAAIEHTLDDEARRASLRRAGLERAKVFTWQRAAAETLDVYRAAVEAHRNR